MILNILNYIFLTGAIFIFILIAHFHVNAIVASSQDKVVIIPFQNLGWLTLSQRENEVISLFASLTFGLENVSFEKLELNQLKPSLFEDNLLPQK